MNCCRSAVERTLDGNTAYGVFRARLAAFPEDAGAGEKTMIKLTRLSGETFVLNADQLSVENLISTPDATLQDVQEAGR